MTRKVLSHVYLTPHQASELTRLSAFHGRTKADLIREGVDLVIADLGGEVEREDAESRRTHSTPPMSSRLAELADRVRALEALLGVTQDETHMTHDEAWRRGFNGLSLPPTATAADHAAWHLGHARARALQSPGRGSAARSSDACVTGAPTAEPTSPPPVTREDP